MKALLTLAAALTLLPASGRAADVTKARWVSSAVSQLAPELGTPAGKPAPAAQVESADAAQARGLAAPGRLANVLSERKMTIKQVWKERAAGKRQKAPQKS